MPYHIKLKSKTIIELYIKDLPEKTKPFPGSCIDALLKMSKVFLLPCADPLWVMIQQRPFLPETLESLHFHIPAQKRTVYRAKNKMTEFVCLKKYSYVPARTLETNIRLRLSAKTVPKYT
jgi:hypothetical protein